MTDKAIIEKLEKAEKKLKSPKKKKKLEMRKFHMHPELLFSVIKAQAGTHEKALLEAVMNAVDAGATQCIVDVDLKGYTITDNGKGFSSRQEIEDFFETFGTPHKEGDATYGKFRMGRGQLFAFSRTIWTSNIFKMDVCIKTRGLDYIFEEDEPMYNGCKIEGTWHDKILANELLNLSREFKLLVRYMQIPIIYNGENISCQASVQKWDAQTEEAYIKVSQNSTTLSVYNLGALVCHYPASKFGIGGIVVAKEQLKVNFARNDVLVSECKVWKKITSSLNKLMGIEVSKKSILSDSERVAIVNNILSGSSFVSQFSNKGLLNDVTHKKPTLNALLKLDKISFGTGNYKTRNVEELVHNRQMSFVLDNSMLERFMVSTPQEFINKINQLIEQNNAEYYRIVAESMTYVNGQQRYYDVTHNNGIQYIRNKFNPIILPIEDLVKSINTSLEIKNKENYTLQEKTLLKVLDKISGRIAGLLEHYLYRSSTNNSEVEVKYKDREIITPRKIMIGVSQMAQAWTDGLSYIVFEEKQLKNPHPHKLIMLMLHEYCHKEETVGTHSHPIEFYNMFHNIALNHAESIDALNYQASMWIANEFAKAGIKTHLDNGLNIKEKYQAKEVIEETVMQSSSFRAR